MNTADTAVALHRLAARDIQPSLLADLDRIFFETSATKQFASDAHRAAFRERWFGRYLAQEPCWFYVAVTPEGSAAGYLAGSMDDPARSERFADIGYFADFASLSARYPAHLHVNLASAWRNRGIGAGLIAMFAGDAAAAGAPGVHVVTDPESRNATFYRRNGFAELARSAWNGRDVVFLGKRLGE